MTSKTSISTHRPSSCEAMALIREGSAFGLHATDGPDAYEFIETKPDGRVAVNVTDPSGKTRRRLLTLKQIENRVQEKGWAFVSELDAYLQRERYVRLDPDTCAKIAVQITHKCMRFPMESYHDRFSDEEMAGLNRTFLNRAFTMLVALFHPTARSRTFGLASAPDNWDAPVIDSEYDHWANAMPRFRPDLTLKEEWRGGTFPRT